MFLSLYSTFSFAFYGSTVPTTITNIPELPFLIIFFLAIGVLALLFRYFYKQRS